MTVKTRWINGNLVFCDSALPYRIYDAVGPDVAKAIEEFVNTPFASANNMAAWTTQVAGSSTDALTAGATGGALLITTGGSDTNGIRLQMQGEAFNLASTKELYFGVNFQISSATESAFLAGLCVTDADCLTAVTDGVYFRKIDHTAAANFILEKANAETSTSALTVAAVTEYTLEFYWDGAALDFWVNGVKGTQPVLTNLTAEYLTPTFEFITGEDASATATVSWLRCIQINT